MSSVSGSFGSIESYYGFAVSSVDCVGNETSIDVCPVQISTEMCGINDSAVVVCEINGKLSEVNRKHCEICNNKRNTGDSA